MGELQMSHSAQIQMRKTQQYIIWSKLEVMLHILVLHTYSVYPHISKKEKLYSKVKMVLQKDLQCC